MSREIKTGDPESRFTNNVVKDSLDRFNGVRFKISDTFTKGIPDIVWAYLGHTYFIEVKVVEDWDHILTRISMDRLQLITMWRLGYHTGNRAFYIVKNLKDGTISLFRLTGIKPTTSVYMIHRTHEIDAIVMKMIDNKKEDR